MRNRLGKIGAGLLSGAAALALLTLPAAANTVSVDITSGTLELFDEFSGSIDTINLGATGTDCASTSSSVTTTGTSSSGTFSSNTNSDTATDVGSSSLRIQLNTSLSGSYSGSALSGGGSATADVWVTPSTGSCATSGAPCTISVGNLSVSGTFNAANPSVLVSGDDATISGGNNTYDTTVGGNAGNCGALIALNNGSATITNAVIEV